MRVRRQGLRFKVVYQGHRVKVKVKVTRAKKLWLLKAYTDIGTLYDLRMRRGNISGKQVNHENSYAKCEHEGHSSGQGQGHRILSCQHLQGWLFQTSSKTWGNWRRVHGRPRCVPGLANLGWWTYLRWRTWWQNRKNVCVCCGGGMPSNERPSSNVFYSCST